MSDVKIPKKEFIAALKSLNTVLEKEDQIKVTGKYDEENLVEDFTNTVMNFVDEGKEADLPEDVVNFFNEYIQPADDEDDEEVEGEDEVEEEEDAAEADDEEAEAPTPKKKAAGKKKTAKPAKTEKTEKKAATAKARDSYGFIEGSANSQVAEMLSKTPMKMGEIKEKMGNTYYTLVKNNPEVFGKTSNSYFYIIGSAAEKAAAEIEKDAVKTPKAPTKKAGPTPKKKSATVKKAEAEAKASPTPKKKAPAKKAAPKKAAPVTKKRPAKK